MSSPPSGSNKTVELNEDTSRFFIEEDFGFSDPDGDAFAGVIVTALSSGELTLNGEPVLSGQMIGVGDLPNLVWTPPADESGTGFAQLGFRVVDDQGSVALDVNEISFDLLPVPDTPVARDDTIRIVEGLDAEFIPGNMGYDMDGDALAAIVVLSLPELGTLFLGDDPITQPGTRIAHDDIVRLHWRSPPGITGRDVARFQFTVETADGDVDETPATVKFDVIAAPLGADKTIAVQSGQSHIFSEGDFGFSDSLGHLFHGVVIAGIPEGSSLRLGDRVLSTGDFVLRSEFSQLVWRANPGEAAAGEFRLEFSVVNDNHNPGPDETNVDAQLNVLTFVIWATPPTGENKTVTISEDGSHLFAASDFGFQDADGDSFAGIVITAIAGKGQLLLNGVLVSAGQTIALTDFGQLAWKPDKDANGAALGSVSFKVMDGGEVDNTALAQNTITFNVTSEPEMFVGTSRRDMLSGTADNDILQGLAGNDSIDGRGAADVMRGGTGNDSYVVDRTSDRTIELAGQGTDVVTSAISWTLAVNVENLILAGSKSVNGLGNAHKNALTGNAGRNTLSGFAGDDILKGMNGEDFLNGGTGRDTLTGGAQRDTFIFDVALTAANRDIITDFSVRDDTIRLENTIFRQLTKTGVLSKDFFKLSTEVKDSNDYIQYNRSTGALIYDANGSGAGGAFQFATIKNHAGLTNLDFLVV